MLTRQIPHYKETLMKTLVTIDGTPITAPSPSRASATPTNTRYRLTDDDRAMILHTLKVLSGPTKRAIKAREITDALPPSFSYLDIGRVSSGIGKLMRAGKIMELKPTTLNSTSNPNWYVPLG